MPNIFRKGQALLIDFNRLKAILSFCEKAPDNFDSFMKRTEKLMKTPIPLKNEDTPTGEDGGNLLRKTQLVTQKNAKSLFIPNIRPIEGPNFELGGLII
jgi:hypothetical protein